MHNWTQKGVVVNVVVAARIQRHFIGKGQRLKAVEPTAGAAATAAVAAAATVACASLKSSSKHFLGAAFLANVIYIFYWADPRGKRESR